MPDRVEDLVRAAADKYKIPRKLALAVAEQESGFNPVAVNPDSGALGTFQFLPSTAKTRGFDALDYRRNIDEGAKYLRELMDKHGGDPDKVLAEYGGVKNDTTYVPAVTALMQKYAAEDTAGDAARRSTIFGAPAAVPGRAATPLPAAASAGMLPPDALNPTPAGPVAGRGTATQNIGTQARQNAVDFSRSYDPRTAVGRENWAGAAGGLASTLAFSVAPEAAAPLGLLQKAVNVLGPIAGAAAAGGAENLGEQAFGTEGAQSSPLAAATRQGAYEAFGKAFMWPISRFGRKLAGESVAQHAADAIKVQADATKAAGQNAVEQVRQQVDQAVQMVRARGQQTVAQAKGAATTASSIAKARTTEALADAELQQAEGLRTVQQQYDNLLAAPPSKFGTAQAVKQTLEGPAKRALDLAGQRVEEAAEKGPAVDIRALKQEVEGMVNRGRPSWVGRPGRRPSASTRNVGYLASSVRSASGAAASASASPAEIAAFNQRLAQSLGISESSLLPGILKQISDAPDSISFGDAHRLKMMLDEAVTWDRPAKKMMERLTKGARITLRDTMQAAGNADYDTATAAYQAVIPLYRKGVGKQIIQLSQTPLGSSKVASLLNDTDPVSARALQQLIVDQSAAGGDAAAGHRAWDSVRSAYAYDHLISGGIDGLGTRVDRLLTQRPEFVRVVFGDDSGKQVLTNLAQLGEAIESAKALGVERVASAQLAGKAGQQATKYAGQTAVDAATAASTQAIAQTKQAGAQQIRGARTAATAANTAMRDQARALAGSSLGRLGERTIPDVGADILRAGALGVHSWFGAQSIMRLLRAPDAQTLVQWMAYSPAHTQMAVKILTSPTTPEMLTAFVREMAGALPARTAAHIMPISADESASTARVPASTTSTAPAIGTSPTATGQ